MALHNEVFLTKMFESFNELLHPCFIYGYETAYNTTNASKNNGYIGKVDCQLSPDDSFWNLYQ